MVRRRHRLAERRKAVGLTQERLAEIMGVDRSTVVRWERADTAPQPWHRPRLARALKVAADELSDLLADIDGEGQDPNPWHLDRGGVDLVSTGHLREEIHRLDERYERVPSSALLGIAGQLHGRAVAVRHAATGRTRRELLLAEMESATLMGQLVWDASHRRDHSTATAYFDQAITAARQVRDVVGEAQAVLRKSFVSLYGTRNPADGLTLACRAARVSRTESSTIAGLSLLHVAEAYAMQGDGRRCERALGEAEAAFAGITRDDPAGFLSCPSQPGRLAGSCWLRLNEPTKAEQALEEARRRLAPRRKSTAIVLGNLARVHIRQRRIDAAASYLNEAIDAVEQTRSAGGLNVVFTTARELRPWRNERVVQEADDRLLTLMTAG